MANTKTKPSGIEWIGDIPESWEIKRLKYTSDIIMGQSPESSDVNDLDGTYQFMQGNAEFTNMYPAPVLFCDNPNKKSRLNDILMSVRAPVGEINISDKIYGIGRGLCSIKSLDYFNKYLWYLMLKSKEDFNYYSNGSTFDAITIANLINFPTIVPPYKEQQAIASFLDAQCEKIDGIITAMEQQIEVLKQYKTSLIAETVTKGLDKSVPMKDSGIEWVEKIPYSWTIKRMQDIGEYKKGPFGSAITLDMFVEQAEDTIKIYEQKNAIYKDSRIGEYFITKNDFIKLKEFEVFPNDIIVSCAGTIGKCFIMPSNMQKGIINQALMRIKLNENVDRRYFLSLFDIILENVSQKYSNGSAIKNIPPFAILKKIKLPFPPIATQHKIVSYLNEKCKLLNNIISEKQTSIETMKFYKKSLIYEYVTGKKRVRI